MSVLLRRHAVLQSIAVEKNLGTVDGQGQPDYAAPATISARVHRESSQVIAADGSTIKTDLTIWVPAGEVPFPNEQDRITFEDTVVIVEEKCEVKTIAGVVDHIKLKCRRG